MGVKKLFCINSSTLEGKFRDWQVTCDIRKKGKMEGKKIALVVAMVAMMFIGSLAQSTFGVENAVIQLVSDDKNEAVEYFNGGSRKMLKRKPTDDPCAGKLCSILIFNTCHGDCVCLSVSLFGGKCVED